MKKKKILIIDDENKLCEIVKKNLELTNEFEVATATNGMDGIKLTKEIKPDLILLDVIMPNMDGGQVAFQIKNNADSKDIPIIFFTATATEEEAASNDGVIGGHPFIAKTASPEELIGRIKRALLNK